ncbi:hypothetical protein TNCV_1847621 [Trichonephila clavipes]|nr:hypothetical protein TNCV_1847621 [Trichonephila clavipes]
MNSASISETSPSFPFAAEEKKRKKIWIRPTLIPLGRLAEGANQRLREKGSSRKHTRSLPFTPLGLRKRESSAGKRRRKLKRGGRAKAFRSGDR